MLQAEGIAAFRGERLVFSELSFTVQPGGALLLMGPNGSGKSSLLRLLAGLVRLVAGRVLWNGEEALTDLPLHARRLAYLGHLDAVKPGLTVAENLAFAATAAAGRVGVHAALADFALDELAELPSRMLSAGQRRRLALARVALSPARLWLLDEPTLGLDTASLEQARAVFGRHRAKGGMIIAATHVALPLPGAAELHLG
ncbi:MAG: heme ABC exporter ATP-binding protein CcmA [Acetobacteraceae bacterium]|nr:heme ABC exporter ATP-binding protein CcmA [Acetobacteraceae bacterium]